MTKNSKMMWGLIYASPHVISSFASRVSSCYIISTWFYLLYISCTVLSFSQFTSPDSGLMANQNTLRQSLRALLCLSYPLKFWPFPLLPTATLGGYATFCLQFCMWWISCTSPCCVVSVTLTRHACEVIEKRGWLGEVQSHCSKYNRNVKIYEKNKK